MARERWGAATNDGAGRRQGPPSGAGGRERAARGAAAPAARPEAAGPRLGPHRHRAPGAAPHRDPAPGPGAGTAFCSWTPRRDPAPHRAPAPAALPARWRGPGGPRSGGRCRREEKGPRVPTDLPEEGRLRKISVQPFPAVQQSQDSCEWPNSDRVTPSCCLPGPSSIPSRAPPPSLLSPANANGWRLHARSLRWYPMRGAELWALPFPVGQQRWGLLSPPEQL